MLTLAELLPQAAPMILLSGYEDPTEEASVCAYVDITESSPFYETNLKGVPTCVALEYMAQTMALLTGITRRKKNLPPKLGFVLGSRKLEVSISAFSLGERYRIAVTCTYQDEEFGSFNCEISDEKGSVVAKGIVNAFQPAEETTPELMKGFA